MNKHVKWNFEQSYTQLPSLFFTQQNPIPVREPKCVIFNEELATTLNVPLQTEVFAGNLIPNEAVPLAQAYAGHQFGYFTRLGDGRAILLGEQITPTGERFDIQLKGSGRTRYSRSGDGRAALGPMLREYIISEAMHALGIPTTRSLAVVETGESVIREKLLTGAILTRVATSHIRVGTFEYATHFGQTDDIRKLADYTIWRDFSNLSTVENKYLQLLKAVVKRQATLIAKWQLVGFIHGVMNTDNMAISGETIDYGPCAFMDVYNPATVFSSIDIQGRYAYENQPQMAVWNLARFAETLLPLLHENLDEAITLAKEEITAFWDHYQDHWLTGMSRKLGLLNKAEGDEALIQDLLHLMHQFKADYTHTFRSLTLGVQEDVTLFASIEFTQWYERWQVRLSQQSSSQDEMRALMKQHNPAVIPRNHQVEEALTAAEKGNYEAMEKLLHILENPYGYTPEQEAYTTLPKPSSDRYRTFCGT